MCRCLHRDILFLFLFQPTQAWVHALLYPLLPFWSRKLCIYSSSGQVYIKSLLFSPPWALSESIFHCWIVNGNGFRLLLFQRRLLSFKIYTECQFLRSTRNDHGIISVSWMLQDTVLIKRYWQIQSSRSKVITATMMKIQILWDVTPCPLVKIYQSFGKVYCLHLQGLIFQEHWLHILT